MLHVNETIVIKSSSVKMAEWVKRLKVLLRSLHTPRVFIHLADTP